jgi:MFS family permease
MEQAPPIEIRKARSFGEQINVTFAFLRENFKSLAKAVLFIVGPAAIVAGALIGYFFFDILSLRGQGDASQVLGALPAMLIGVLFAFISGILLSGVVNDYVRLYLDRNGPDFTLAELWAEVKGDLGKITLTMIGIAVLFGGLYLILVLLVVSKIWFLVALFTLVFIAFAAYMYVPLTLLITVRLCEGEGIATSISRCFELVKGNWWKTFGILLVPNMVANAISSILIFPAEMFISLASFGGIHTGGGALKAIVTILMMLGMVLAYLLATLPMLGATLQYFNLVEKHDGVGLMARIQAIGNEDDRNLNANTY